MGRVLADRAVRVDLDLVGRADLVARDPAVRVGPGPAGQVEAAVLHPVDPVGLACTRGRVDLAAQVGPAAQVVRVVLVDLDLDRAGRGTYPVDRVCLDRADPADRDPDLVGPVDRGLDLVLVGPADLVGRVAR